MTRPVEPMNGTGFFVWRWRDPALPPLLPGAAISQADHRVHLQYPAKIAQVILNWAAEQDTKI